MKRIIFLIIASLLVIGLVLPGCGDGGGGGIDPIRTLKTPGTLTIGVTGAMGFDQGKHALWGAQLAAADLATFTAGGQSLTVTIKSVDTNEILDPGGASGTAAVANAIGDCDFMVGGFRTEGLVVYREPIMSANMTYMSCGVATESLAHSVVTNYDRYQWFFRATPFNDFLVSVMQSKLFLYTALSAKTYFSTGAGNSSGTLTQGYKCKMAIIAEDAEWTRTGREIAYERFNYAGYLVGKGLWLVPTLSTSLVGTLNEIKAANPDVNMIYTILSGPVGTVLAHDIGTIAHYVQVIGTNVEAQRAAFGTESGAEGMIFTDGWAPGVNLTDTTAAFLAGFGAAHSDVWPIYTAGTYDAVHSLVEALISEGYADGTTVKYVDTDIVTYLEGATRTEGVAATKSGVYPLWDTSTVGNFTPCLPYPVGPTYVGQPAINQAQVLAIYPWLSGAKFSDGTVLSPWAWSPNSWTMGPHTSHDVVFGTEWSVGTGSQWQYLGVGPATNLTKVNVWPTKLVTYGSPLYAVGTIAEWLGTIAAMTAGYGEAYTAATIKMMQDAGLWDQYGWYNFAYDGGGKPLDLADWYTYLATVVI